MRPRDIATTVGITERSVYATVTDLTAAGYVVKDTDTDGRRNRYQIQPHLPLPETIARERTIGEVLDVLVDSARKPARRTRPVTAGRTTPAVVRPSPSWCEGFGNSTRRESGVAEQPGTIP